MELEQGDILGGKYRVERLLGRGGMGAVFAATHLELDELVAIKVLHGDAQSAVGMARFQREARAAVRLKSQHVARVLDVDRLPNGGRYMVLEYLDGLDLDRFLHKRGRLPVADAASYILQACEGLAEAHALGMVHRDIKLQNLFLTHGADGAPLVKILDFGLVKVACGPSGEKEASLTDPSTMMGSLRYMSPEQLRPNPTVDARADVWALGVCLYYMISGEMPFAEEHLGALYAAIGGRPVVRLDVVDPAIPREVADIVERALEKNVTRRFQDVRELAEALEPFGVDAGNVVGIAWRISNVLRPRLPVTMASSPAFPDAASEADTAPRPAPAEALAIGTAPLEREEEMTLAIARPTPPNAETSAETDAETDAGTDAETASEAAAAHSAVDLAPARAASRSQGSRRYGFALMAGVAVVVSFIGTSSVLRGRPPSAVASPAVDTKPAPAVGPSSSLVFPSTAAPPSSEPAATAPPTAPAAPAATAATATAPTAPTASATPSTRTGTRGAAKDKAGPAPVTANPAPATTPKPTATPASTAKKVRDRPSSYDQY